MSNTPNLKLNILNDSGEQIFYVNQTTGINSSLISTYTNTTASTNSSTASFVLNGGLSIANSSNSVSSTEGGSLTLAGGISVAKTMYVGENVYTVRISSGSIATPGLTTGTLYSTNVTSTNIIGTNVTSTNVVITNLSSGTLNVDNLTTGNINLTGTLSQNGVPYSSSQWTNTTGNAIIYTNGNVIINNGLLATFNTNTIGSIFTTGGNIGIATTSPGYNLDVTGDINFSGSLYQNGVLFTSGGGGGGSSQWTTTTGNTITYTSGNVLISKQLSITNTAEASATTTAAVTISGGLGVSKSMVIGSSLNVGGVCTEYGGIYTGTNGADPSGTTFTTNISFSSATIRSFTMNINVSVLASTNLYDKYTIEGIYTPNIGWSINDTVLGDNTGITFGIDASGNITFFSPYYSSWSSTTLIYHIFAYSISGTYNPITMPTSSDVILPGTLTIQTTDYATTPSTGALIISGGASISKNLYVVDTLFTTNGNVGIGTTSPGFKLDVIGGANISTSLTSAALYSTNVTSTNIVATSLSSGNAMFTTSITVPSLLASTSISSASIQGTNSTITNAVHTSLSSANAMFTSSITTASLLASTSISSGALYSTNITSTNVVATNLTTSSLNVTNGSIIASFNSHTIGALIMTSGNVGIGTTSPGVKLDVIGSANISTSLTSAALYSTNVTSTNIVATSLSSGNAMFTTSITVPSLLASTSISSASIQGTNSTITNAVHTTLSSANAMFTSSITTASLLASTFISSGALYSTNITSTNVVATNLTTSSLNVTNGSIIASFNSHTIGALIMTSGNVGIGTTSPGVKLDVIGSANISTSLTSAALYSTNVTSTNIVATSLSSGNAMFTTSITVPSLLASTSISSASIQGTNSTITNAVHTTLSSANAMFTTSITVPSLLATTLVSSASIQCTNSTITNAVHTSLSSGNAMFTTSITTAALLASTSISSASIQGTNSTITNAVHTTLSSANAMFTTSITVPSLLATTLVSSASIQCTNVTSTNIVATALSAGNAMFTTSITVPSLLASTSISSGALYSTNATSTNIVATALSAGNAMFTTSITVPSLLASTSISSGALYSTNATSTNIVATALSAGNGRFTNGITSSSILAITTLNTNWNTPHQFINNATGNPGVLSALSPNVTLGNNVSFYVGQTIANGNTGQLSFGYQGSNNTANNLKLGFYGGAGGHITILNNGNVGINNTIPAYNLDVSGDIAIPYNNVIRVKNVTNTKLMEVVFENGTDQTRIYTPGDFSSTPKMVLQHDGNVGIGTTTPNYTLDVTGTANVTTSISTSSLYSTNISSSNILTTNLYYSGIGIMSQISGASRVAIISVSNTVANVNNQFQLYSYGLPGAITQSNLTINTSSGAYNIVSSRTTNGQNLPISLGVSVDGNVTITRYLTMQTNGNVGINTSVPGYNLDVNGQINCTTTINAIWNAAHQFVNNGTGNPGVLSALAPNVTVGNDVSLYVGQTVANGNTAQISFGYQGSNNTGNNIKLGFYGGGGSFITLLRNGNMGIGTGSPTSTLQINGSLAKSSGTFDIKHPINSNKRLVHSFIEGPRCDLIYRGTVNLVNGQAIVNLDTDCVQDSDCGMENGTFEALCRNPVKYLHNNNSFNRVRGIIDKNILTIICEDNTSTESIDWLVVAERKDSDIYQWNRTNQNGYLQTEY
jgi:hypothetical protein